MVDQVRGIRYVGGEYVQAIRPTGATISLNATAVADTTAAAVQEGVYHIATTTWTFLQTSVAGDPADSTHTLLAPGERLLVLPNKYVSVIKLSTATDGIVRMTLCE